MRILLAEDEQSLSRALVALLEKNNYSVDAVYDGEEALTYIESGIYDAVILDVMMPKRDGISVLREMRSRGNNVPVLILSAKSEVDDKVLGLDSGANDYLTKPFDIKELLARIRAITRTGDERCDSRMHFGNLTLDLATYELSAKDGSCKLANKEFQMMELLLRNPNRLISTNHFMQQIWGNDSDTELNVVWVYISYLRQKLRNIHANVEIKAARGVGYTLAEIKT